MKTSLLLCLISWFTTLDVSKSQSPATTTTSGASFHYTSTGGGWKSMFANVGVANLLQQAGLVDQLDHVATNSGSSWFSLQFFFSQPFFDAVTESTPDELYDFVTAWMDAYSTVWPPAEAFDISQCQANFPPALHGLCPIFTYFGGDWAEFTRSMLTQVSMMAYNDPDFVSRAVDGNIVPVALQNTKLHIQVTLVPTTRDRATGDGSFLGYSGAESISTLPIPMQYRMTSATTTSEEGVFSGTIFADAAAGTNFIIYNSPMPANFSFEAFVPFGLYPGIGATPNTTAPANSTTTTTTFSHFSSPVVATLAATTSAAAGVFSGLNPSMLAQAVSPRRAQVLANTSLPPEVQAGAIAELEAGFNAAFYNNPFMDKLAVCPLFPEPCEGSTLLTTDGIYSDNPSLALNVASWQSLNPDSIMNTTLKVLIVNADVQLDNPIYNDALYLSYFSTDFNADVPPGGYVWAPGHPTPWKSPQIFVEALTVDDLVGRTVPMEDLLNDTATTTMLTGTTLENTEFGTVAGQTVELMLINIMSTIPVDIIGPDYILNYTEPLASLAENLAASEELLTRIVDFFYGSTTTNSSDMSSSLTEAPSDGTTNSSDMSTDAPSESSTPATATTSNSSDMSSTEAPSDVDQAPTNSSDTSTEESPAGGEDPASTSSGGDASSEAPAASYGKSIRSSFRFTAAGMAAVWIHLLW